MVSIRKTVCISYVKNSDGRYFITAEIIADAASELPDVNAFDAYILAQGSTAQVMETGEFYVMDSSGNWCKKSDSYTKEELNVLLAGKIDKKTGKGLSANDFTTDRERKAFRT